MSGKQTPVQPTRTGDQRIDGAVPGSETLAELPATATLADVIDRVNIIIRRLERA